MLKLSQTRNKDTRTTSFLNDSLTNYLENCESGNSGHPHLDSRVRDHLGWVNYRLPNGVARIPFNTNGRKSSSKVAYRSPVTAIVKQPLAYAFFAFLQKGVYRLPLLSLCE